MVSRVSFESPDLWFLECRLSNSRCHGTAVLYGLRRRPGQPEVLEKKEAHSVCVVKFCLGCTQMEISLTNFCIRGENWSSVFHRRRSSDWDAISVSWWKEGQGLQQSVFVSSRSLGGKTVVPTFPSQIVGTRSALLICCLPSAWHCSHT